jgi:hypothetical protein
MHSGIPVPQSITTVAVLQPNTDYYVVPNTVFVSDGTLKVLEVYASVAGLINIYVRFLRHQSWVILNKRFDSA